MAKPKYATRTHKQACAKFAADIAAGRGWCAETVCMEERDGRSRFIPPSTPRRLWHAAHTDDGLAYKGPAHARCNNADGARRGNVMRADREVPKRRRVL